MNTFTLHVFLRCYQIYLSSNLYQHVSHFKISNVSYTYTPCMHTNSVTLYTLHVHYTPCMHTIHPACTLYTLHAHYTPCMHTIHPACTLYTLHAHYTPCMHTIHPACTLYTLHVHYTPVNVYYTHANEIPSTTHVDQLNNIVIFLRNTINARIAIYM